MKQKVSREQEGAGGGSEGAEDMEMGASERNGHLAGE